MQFEHKFLVSSIKCQAYELKSKAGITLLWHVHKPDCFPFEKLSVLWFLLLTL